MLSNRKFIGIVIVVILMLIGGFAIVLNIERPYEKQAFTSRSSIAQTPILLIDEGASIIKAIEIAESRDMIKEGQTPAYSSVQIFSNIQEAITIELLTEVPMVEINSDSTMMVIGSSFSVDTSHEEVVNVVTIFDNTEVNTKNYWILRLYFDSGDMARLGYTETSTSDDNLSLLEWLGKDNSFYTDGKFEYKIIETISTKDYDSIDIRLPDGMEYNLMSYKRENILVRSVVPRNLKELKLNILENLLRVKAK